MPQLQAYNRYLETIAKRVVTYPDVMYIHYNLFITTVGSVAPSWRPKSDYGWADGAVVSLWGRAYTEDGKPVDTKLELRQLVAENPSLITIEPTAVLPSKRDAQIKVMGTPIERFTTERFKLDQLPSRLLLHVQGPDFYALHGRRKYVCSIWRVSERQLRTR